MPTDNFTVISFLIGTGIVVVSVGITQAGWKHWLLIGVLIATGAVFIFTGVTWPWISVWWPKFAGVVADISTHPASWFSAVILALSANLLIKDTGPSLFAAMKAKLAGRPRPFPTAGNHQSPQVVLDQEVPRDLLHLLDFGVYQTTLTMLSHLVDEIPDAYDTALAPLPLEHANSESHHTAQIYMQSVRRHVCDGSDRAAKYLSVMKSAESEAERELRGTPLDKRPEGIDPLVLRDYAISYRQAVYTASFLRNQRREIEEVVIRQRSTLIERFRLRAK